MPRNVYAILQNHELCIKQQDYTSEEKKDYKTELFSVVIFED